MALSVRLVDADFGGGSLEVSTAGVSAGELLVALVDTDAGGGPPAPTGWTVRATADADSGSNTTWALVKDDLGPGDAAYTFAIGGGADGAVHLVAIAASSGTPQWDDADATGVGPSTSTSMVAPSVTAEESSALLLCFWMLYSGTSEGGITPPGGMDEVVDNVRSNGWGHRSIYSETVGSGATGTRTATASDIGFGHNSTSLVFSEVGGGETVTGVAAATMGPLAGSATGKRVVHGTAVGSFGALNGSGAGRRTVAGTAAGQMAALGGDASGRRTVHGAAAAPMAALDGSAPGHRIVAGSAEATLGSLDATGSGRRTVRGQAAGSFGALTGSAQGNADGQVTGVATADLAPLAAVATGRRTVHGTAAATMGALVGTIAVATETTGLVTTDADTRSTSAAPATRSTSAAASTRSTTEAVSVR